MILIYGNKNIDIKNKAINDYIKYYALQYINQYKLIKDARLNNIIKYFKNNFNIKKFYNLLNYIINKSYIYTNINNQYSICVQDKQLDKYINLINYGNLEIKPHNILKNAYKYALRKL